MPPEKDETMATGKTRCAVLEICLQTDKHTDRQTYIQTEMLITTLCCSRVINHPWSSKNHASYQSLLQYQ